MIGGIYGVNETRSSEENLLCSTCAKIVLAKEYYEYLTNDTRLEPSDDLPMLPFGARTVRSEYKIHWARRVARQTADGRPQAPAA